MWAISRDTPEESRGFMEKIAADGKGPVQFQLLSDPDHRVIDGYGLQDARYLKQRQEGIPVPTVYVIDRSGKVTWRKIDESIRNRPPTSEVRAALNAALR
jgi:peroxiredoxin